MPNRFCKYMSEGTPNPAKKEYDTRGSETVRETSSGHRRHVVGVRNAYWHLPAKPTMLTRLPVMHAADALCRNGLWHFRTAKKQIRNKSNEIKKTPRASGPLPAPAHKL